MHARKTAALAIITGLATATSLLGTAGSAFAAPARTAPDGSIKTTTNTPLPKVAQRASEVAKTDIRSRNATDGPAAAAASYRNCYVYSNGTGDLCNYWNWNLTGSRGGTYVADVNWSDNYFVSPASGQYQSWNDNTYSTANYDHYWSARVYTNAYGSGYWKRIWQYTGQNNTGVFFKTLSSNYWN